MAPPPAAGVLRFTFQRNGGRGTMTDADGTVLGSTNCVNALLTDGFLTASCAIRELGGEVLWVVEEHGSTRQCDSRFVVFDSSGAEVLGAVVGHVVWRGDQPVARLLPRGLLKRGYQIVGITSDEPIASVRRLTRRPGYEVGLSCEPDDGLRSLLNSVAYVLFRDDLERRTYDWD